MKKASRLIVLCILLLCLLLSTVAAWGQQRRTGLVIELQNADTQISVQTEQREPILSEKSGQTDVYPMGRRFEVTYRPKSLKAGEHFVLLLRSGPDLSLDSILYLCDKTVSEAEAAQGYVVFDVFPRENKPATLQLSSPEWGKAITLAAVKPVYEGMTGDADGDESLSMGDSMAVLRHITGVGPLSTWAAAVADYNGDGAITAEDAVAILRHITGAARYGEGAK